MTQISINVSPEQLGKFSENIIDVFKELSSEDKKDLAKQIMLKWLEEPVAIEKEVREKEVFKQMRSSSYDKDKTDSELRRSYEYDRKMKDFKTSKETMVEEITNEIKNHYKSVATDLAKTDPQFSELMNKVSDDLRLQLPTIVRNAMVDFFMNNMNMWQNSMWEHINHYHTNQQ